jgi:lysophospholipase L1-like esterase
VEERMNKKVIKPIDSEVRITGRYTTTGKVTDSDYTLYLAFSASGIEFKTNADKVTAEIVTDYMKDEKGCEAYLGVLVDNDELPYRKFVLDKDVAVYDIFDRKKYEQLKLDELGRHIKEGSAKYKSIVDKVHVVRIVKYTESYYAATGIRNITLEKEDREVESEPTKKRKHFVQIIGDSITCGYGVEASGAEESFCTATENPFKAYAVKACRELKYDYELVSRSGIGIVSIYTGDGVKNTDDFLMPELYPYKDRFLARKNGKEPEEYEFKRKPDLIVINLGTNDYSYTKDDPIRIEEFKDKYFEFVKTIRHMCPTAKITLAVGIMGQELFPAIKEVAEKMKDYGTHKVEALLFPAQEGEIDGYGADWHPSEVTQAKEAEVFKNYLTYAMIS